MTECGQKCTAIQVCNPATGRCVNRMGPIGKRVLAGDLGPVVKKPAAPKPKNNAANKKPAAPKPKNNAANKRPAAPKPAGGQRVTIMVGQTGSGKSTYAEKIAKNNNVIVSSDVLKSSRPRINAAIRTGLKSGKSVIVDATNPTRERRQEIAKIARNAGASTRCVHMNTEKSVATGRSHLTGKTKYIAAATFHKRFEALGNECNTVTRVSGNNAKNKPANKPNKPANKPNKPANKINVNINKVIREMIKPEVTRAGHFGIKGISPAARAEVARIVGPLYRGTVPTESFFYGGQVVTASKGRTPLHVVEDLLVLAGHAARNDTPINLINWFLIEKRDILKAVDANPEDFDFSKKRNNASPGPGPSPVPGPARRNVGARNVKAMLAHKYSPGTHDLTRYFASEKMDGMRALFDGTKLVSRNGNVIAAPDWFLAAIPNGTYDGELFAGRGFAQFQSVLSIAKKSRPIDAEWKTLQYRIFDDPMSTTPFETTYARLRREIPTCDSGSPGSGYVDTGSFVCLQPQHRLTNQANLNGMFKTIKGKGGEGVMLRDAGATYAGGTRSKVILKVKNVQDAEAKITGFELRPDGSLKSLIVEWNLGGKRATFNVGTGLSESDRQGWKKLFRIGDLVTVQYSELTSLGKARFPVYKSVRTNI